MCIQEENTKLPMVTLPAKVASTKDLVKATNI
jgi:hypothetical protein